MSNGNSDSRRYFQFDFINILITILLALVRANIEYRSKASIFLKVDALLSSVNYHEFTAYLKNVFWVSIAKITLRSLWAVARTAFL